MTSHYPDLSPLISRKFASSNKRYPIWVVTRHQYEVSVLVPQASFRRETSDDVAKSLLFCQGTIDQIDIFVSFFVPTIYKETLREVM